MRAAVLRTYNDDLSLEQVADPACAPDGVVLRVLACGICRSDWHGWTGEHPRVKPGQIPGHEYCGEVVEAGAQSTWQVGDRVVAPFILACGACPDCQSGHGNICARQRLPGFTEPGAFAEFISVPFAHNLARLPDSLSPAVAAEMSRFQSGQFAKPENALKRAVSLFPPRLPRLLWRLNDAAAASLISWDAMTAFLRRLVVVWRERC